MLFIFFIELISCDSFLDKFILFKFNLLLSIIKEYEFLILVSLFIIKLFNLFLLIIFSFIILVFFSFFDELFLVLCN